MSLENREQRKEPVPQIDEVSGLSGDYNNAFKNFHGYNPERPDECIAWFVEDEQVTLAKNPNSLLIEKYVEVYPAARYLDVVTEKNKEDVEYIDAAVEKIQEFYRDRIRSHIKEQPLAAEVKKDIIELVKEVRTLMKRVSGIIEGEVITVSDEDTPLNVEYLHELVPLTEPSTPEDWYDRIKERMAANDGKVLPKYVEKTDAIDAPADHASPRRQKRIQRINGIITSLNKALSSSGMSQAIEKKNVGMVVSIIRPMFLKKLAIITRMVKAEAA